MQVSVWVGDCHLNEHECPRLLMLGQWLNLGLVVEHQGQRGRERERSVLPATDACSMWARPDSSFGGFVGTSAAIAGQPGVSNLRDL